MFLCYSDYIKCFLRHHVKNSSQCFLSHSISASQLMFPHLPFLLFIFSLVYRTISGSGLTNLTSGLKLPVGASLEPPSAKHYCKKRKIRSRYSTFNLQNSHNKTNILYFDKYIDDILNTNLNTLHRIIFINFHLHFYLNVY